MFVEKCIDTTIASGQEDLNETWERELDTPKVNVKVGVTKSKLYGMLFFIE